MKLQRIQLPCPNYTNDHADIMQLIKSCGRKKDINTIRRICVDKPWITDDTSIATTLICSYARCGSLKEARDVFDQLTVRDIVSWNAIISGYAEQGFGEQAIACFREMEDNKVAPNAVTFTCTLTACAITRDFGIVKEIHAQVRELGLLNKHIILGTALVNAYGKCGALNEAREVFDQLTERNVVSWNVLIGGYTEHGFSEEALACFREIEYDTVRPNAVTYISSLKACATVGAPEIVREIHTHIRKDGLLNKHIALGNSLVNAYAKCGAMKESQEVFDQLGEWNVVSWNVLIDGYAEHGFDEQALACFREMESNGVTPNAVTYACSLKASAIVGNLETVKYVHAKVTGQGLLNKNIVLGTALVDAYGKCNAMNEAREVLDQLPERNTVLWNALISGYSEQGFGKEAVICLRKMQIDGVTPDRVTYTCILKAFAILEALEFVKQIHAQVREQGLLNKYINLGSALVNAYAKCGTVEESQKIFDQLEERNVVSWNSIISGYAEQGLGEEALACFREMQNDRVVPNSVTYTCCLTACACVGALHIVQEIHAHVREQRVLNKHVQLGTALVNAYAKCGAVKAAKEVFDQLEERNVLSWNAVLGGYAQLSQVYEMSQMFNRMMVECNFPDSVTFLVLLSWCIHGALLDEGERMFCMIGAFGLVPTQEHYICVVDLLGRAGQFDKAKFFVIRQTPTLLAFMGACQKWINVDLGIWVFEKLIQVDQNCPSAYVCMSNIYAADGMVKEEEVLHILVKETRSSYLNIKQKQEPL